jgi:hypothetical protein
MNRIWPAGGIVAASFLGSAFTMIAPASASPSCTTGTGMEICVTYESSVSTQAETEFNSVAQDFSNAITNNTSASPISIDVSFGTLSGDASTSTTATYSVGSFSNVVADLAPTEKSHGYTLPSTDVTNGGTWFMPQAEAKVLGLTLPGNAAAYDGTITFSKSTSFGYAKNTTPTNSQTSFQAAAEHEIDEVLGRTSTLNANGTLASLHFADTFDLFRYASPGIAGFAENAAAYASVNGGTTNLGTFESTIAGDDRSDWFTTGPGAPPDSQDSVLHSDESYGLSISDGIILQALGYSIAPNNGDGLFSTADEPTGASAGLTQIPSVPEPASLPILAAGAGFALLLRRRRLVAAVV